MRAIRMRNLLPFVCFLWLRTVGSAATDEVVIQGSVSPLNITPTYDHGYLAVYDNGISVYSRDGSPVMRIARPHPGIASLVNADIDTDGAVAVAVNEMRPPGQILIFDPDGSPAEHIETGSFLPSHVCFSPDHSIWTLGTDYDHILRHYSRGGELLGRFLPRSSFPADGEPGQIIVGMWSIRIANGRIGLSLRGAGGNGRLWLEADLNGKEIGRWSEPPFARPAAMTESGTIYAQGPSGFFVLDHVSGDWKAVSPSSQDRLLGADGEMLVFKVKGMDRIRRVEKP